MKIKFKKIHPGAIMPKHSHLGDAGLDLTSVAIDMDEYGNEVHDFGLAVEIPLGYVGLMFPRSSNANHLEMPSNCVGVIDSNYRGSMKVKMRPIMDYRLRTTKFEPDLFEKNRQKWQVGDRVCQLVIVPHITVQPEWAEVLSETIRGENGYGSTGK